MNIVSIKEASKLTGLTEKQIRRRIETKKIKAQQFSKFTPWMIPTNELKKLKAEE